MNWPLFGAYVAWVCAVVFGLATVLSCLFVALLLSGAGDARIGLRVFAWPLLTAIAVAYLVVYYG